MDDSLKFTKEAMKNKIFYILCTITFLVILISYIIKVFHYPNHLFVLLAGLLLLNILCLPYFLYVNLKNPENQFSLFYHIVGISFAFILLLILFSWYIFPILQSSMRIPMVSHLQVSVVVIPIALVTLVYFTFLLIKDQDHELQKSRRFFIIFYLSSILILGLSFPILLQAPDRLFNPSIPNPAYEPGIGPLIYIDEGHNNFHTLQDRLITTGRILEKDGYRVKSYKGSFKKDQLKDCKILIIINALNTENIEKWSLPTPSAFSQEEIEVVKEWVGNGGSLLLVADHMPMPGAAYNLANAFGYELENGHANDTVGMLDYFYRGNGTLRNNVITNGRNSFEEVDSIITYSGHAFRIPDNAINIMTFDSNYLQWNPDTAWHMSAITPYSIYNYSQGAYSTYGEGKVVVLGEAMMITAQLGAGLSMIKMGMNSNEARYNYQLLLNIIHWLDSITE